MEWQTIDTAPKDGTIVDVWAWMRYTNARYLNGVWEFDSPDSGYTEDIPNNPTHWMPLPKAPNE